MWQIPRRSPDAAWASQLIRGARARHGYDHVWAAQLLGVTPAFLFMIECGMSEPSVSFCKRVIGTLSMPPDEAAELLAAAGAVEEEVRQWQSA